MAVKKRKPEDVMSIPPEFGGTMTRAMPEDLKPRGVPSAPTAPTAPTAQPPITGGTGNAFIRAREKLINQLGLTQKRGAEEATSILAEQEAKTKLTSAKADAEAKQAAAEAEQAAQVPGLISELTEGGFPVEPQAGEAGQEFLTENFFETVKRGMPKSVGQAISDVAVVGGMGLAIKSLNIASGIKILGFKLTAGRAIVGTIALGRFRMNDLKQQVSALEQRYDLIIESLNSDPFYSELDAINDFREITEQINTAEKAAKSLDKADPTNFLLGGKDVLQKIENVRFAAEHEKTSALATAIALRRVSGI